MSNVLGDADLEATRNTKAYREQKDLDAALAAIMQHPQTRAWMYWLLESCSMYRTTFDRSALIMAFNEGGRNVGLQITAQLMRVTPDSYTQMVLEAKVKND
jgi:hypothetical protein